MAEEKNNKRRFVDDISNAVDSIDRAKRYKLEKQPSSTTDTTVVKVDSAYLQTVSTTLIHTPVNSFGQVIQTHLDLGIKWNVPPYFHHKSMMSVIPNIENAIIANKHIWLYGPPGSGKLTLALLFNKEYSKDRSSLPLFIQDVHKGPQVQSVLSSLSKDNIHWIFSIDFDLSKHMESIEKVSYYEPHNLWFEPHCGGALTHALINGLPQNTYTGDARYRLMRAVDPFSLTNVRWIFTSASLPPDTLVVDRKWCCIEL